MVVHSVQGRRSSKHRCSVRGARRRGAETATANVMLQLLSRPVLLAGSQVTGRVTAHRHHEIAPIADGRCNSASQRLAMAARGRTRRSCGGRHGGSKAGAARRGLSRSHEGGVRRPSSRAARWEQGRRPAEAGSDSSRARRANTSLTHHLHLPQPVFPALPSHAQRGPYYPGGAGRTWSAHFPPAPTPAPRRGGRAAGRRSRGGRPCRRRRCAGSSPTPATPCAPHAATPHAAQPLLVSYFYLAHPLGRSCGAAHHGQIFVSGDYRTPT